jgi:hypothetical protein
MLAPSFMRSRHLDSAPPCLLIFIRAWCSLNFFYKKGLFGICGGKALRDIVNKIGLYGGKFLDNSPLDNKNRCMNFPFFTIRRARQPPLM